MKSNQSLEEISDGRLYNLTDMVRADCMDCVGCCDCCQKMEETIYLDPLDFSLLQKETGKKLEELLQKELVLKPVDGVIMPFLRMDASTGRCPFLSNQGRCQIHSARPGICRLFPLGRLYQKTEMKYFLQVHECKKTNRSKIRVSKWLERDNIAAYEEFIWNWHQLQLLLGEYMKEHSLEEAKTMSMKVLETFYLLPWTQEFYSEFSNRRKDILDEISRNHISAAK